MRHEIYKIRQGCCTVPFSQIVQELMPVQSLQTPSDTPSVGVLSSFEIDPTKVTETEVVEAHPSILLRIRQSVFPLRFKCYLSRRNARVKARPYSVQCHQRAVSSTQDRETSESAFLDTVSSGRKNVWIVHIVINGTEIPFKLDTGAGVTAVSKQVWEVLGKTALQAPHQQLYGPAKNQVPTISLSPHPQCEGGWSTSLCHKQSPDQSIGVPCNYCPTAGVRMDFCEASTTKSWQGKFPKVFQGLGTLSADYHIQLHPDAKPHTLFTPRYVPLPLRAKVSEELERMEKAGVISKVSEPTPWCAGLVVVPKKSGKVRIYVDMKSLNQSVWREVHPLPKVDETLAQLTGAKVFSKLDANSGFWQIPQSQSSRLLTTFIAPMGRYCFNKLPFGIYSAPEHFQRRMSELLTGLCGVLCHMDDVLDKIKQKMICG